MGRLPGLKVKEVEKILRRAGFVEDRVRGSHITFYSPERDVFTTVPFHSRDIATGTLRAIIKQTGMSVDEFVGYLRKRKN